MRYGVEGRHGGRPRRPGQRPQDERARRRRHGPRGRLRPLPARPARARAGRLPPEPHRRRRARRRGGGPGRLAHHHHGLAGPLRQATGLQASAEAAFQFGHRGPDDHEANAFALAAGYVFDVRYRPALRFEWDRATGDGDPEDARSREFNNLFPTNHAHYGYADLLGWRNMHAFEATLSGSPRAGHFVSADVLRFRLFDARGRLEGRGGRGPRPRPHREAREATSETSWTCSIASP